MTSTDIGFPADFGTRAALLPGTGSDEVFVRSVFAEPLRAAGVTLHAPSPLASTSLIGGLWEALDAAADAADAPLVVGGISFGAHLSVRWALANQHRCAGLLLALPAWTGAVRRAPARLAARASAEQVERAGVETTLRTATTDMRPWLADELRRAWRRHGELLAPFLRAAADYPAPEARELALLNIPVGIAACTDDPVHPSAVAREWASAPRRAHVVETSLAAIGRDRACLGHATLAAFRRACDGT